MVQTWGQLRQHYECRCLQFQQHEWQSEQQQQLSACGMRTLISKKNKQKIGLFIVLDFGDRVIKFIVLEMDKDKNGEKS